MANVHIFIDVFIKLKMSSFSLFTFSSFSILKGSAEALRSRVLARLASLAQTGELARSLY